MRIIEKKAYVEPEVIETCHKCHTEFAYTRADIGSDRDGSYVKCPSCAAFIAAKTPVTPV
jgi:predicted Zn finger-like uncharacterized protein